jgi:branched-chain amino acid transport system permease protein
MLMGINLRSVYTLTFALGTMLAGLAGASLLSINPAYPYMGLVPVWKSWFVLILVGLGNVYGSIIGGFIVGILETVSHFYVGAAWQDIGSLAVIITLLIVKPTGLFGSSVKGVWER